MAPPAVTTQVAIGVTSVFLTILGAIIFRKLTKERIPTEWEKVGSVKELFVYPLKSGKGSSAQSLFVTDKGVKETEKNDNSIELRDRAFVIYTSKEKEVRTARQLPKSVTISIQAAEKGVIISAPNKVDLYINVPQVKNNVKIALCWGRIFGSEYFTCTDCGDSVAKWLSNYLLNKDEGLRLGYGDGSINRNVSSVHKKWAEYYTKMDNSMAGIFSDLAALHLVNSATIDDLNERLADDQNVTVKNFRPNLLVEGPVAFSEDHWQFVKAGDVVMKVCLECLRCIETTVSQNGEMNKQREPLNTLESYRKSKGPFNFAVMGIYLKVLKAGKIKRGDAIYVSKSS